MSEVLEANIFFFITSIAVVVLTGLLSVLFYYLITILRTVRRIVDRVESGTATIADDIEQLRTYVLEESFLARFLRRAGLGRERERAPEEESLARRTPLRALKPDRKSKSDVKVKSEI
jgi:adenylosuccinate lyase